MRPPSFFIALEIAYQCAVINNSDSQDLNVLISYLAILKHSYLNNFLSFQLFHAYSRLYVFKLRASGLTLISSISYMI